MKLVVPKPQRCAIYTRKSTEHNLEAASRGSDLEWLEHAAGEKLLRNPREQ
jgi:hypothetical protein